MPIHIATRRGNQAGTLNEYPSFINYINHGIRTYVWGPRVRWRHAGRANAFATVSSYCMKYSWRRVYMRLIWMLCIFSNPLWLFRYEGIFHSPLPMLMSLDCASLNREIKISPRQRVQERNFCVLTSSFMVTSRWSDSPSVRQPIGSTAH